MKFLDICFQKGFLSFGFKVEFFFSPLYALSQVLKPSASLFWCSAEINYMINMCFALASFRNVFVHSFKYFIVSKLVFFLKKFLLIRKLVLISLQHRELFDFSCLHQILDKTRHDHPSGGATLAHLTIENTGSVGIKSLQLFNHGIEVALPWGLFINDGHPCVIKVEAVIYLLELLVHPGECDEVLVIVEVDGVLDILPVLRVLGVRVAVV